MICTECAGEGYIETLVGKLYPNGHTEISDYEECELCGATGEIDYIKIAVNNIKEKLKSKKI
ncbi:MAG: hypothetical protein PF569_02225 [Candidatus Woesearchaeota archaeon]|jgi:hypothetical protein|nr:hypothetical protein [Candidatus Woesearchaeota archaeon]